MASLEELILQRITDATRAGMPQIAGSSIPRPQTIGSNVADQMGRGMAAPPSTVADMAAQNLNPEDYNYFVEIQRRNVMDPETQESIGWDKNVRRWAELRRKKEPSLDDLSSEGMKRDDKRRSRDAMGRFVTEKGRKIQQDDLPPDIFGYGDEGDGY